MDGFFFYRKEYEDKKKSLKILQGSYICLQRSKELTKEKEWMKYRNGKGEEKLLT